MTLARVSDKQRVFLDAMTRLRPKVFSRDHYTCRHCDAPLSARLELFNFAKKGEVMTMDDLVSLCPVCMAWTKGSPTSSRGQLVPASLGGGRFAFEIVKWTPSPAA